MSIKQAQDGVRYVCHSNGVIPCPNRDAWSDRARAEWRRDPATGRLQMHWRATHALRPLGAPDREPPASQRYSRSTT